MTLKSGWCLDEILYTDLDNHEYAARLHTRCKKRDCPCPNHAKEERDGQEQQVPNAIQDRAP